MGIKRDTTIDFFKAVIDLVKENGHYEKAAAIMDYYLPNERESAIYEAFELSNYEFDFNAVVNFGGSEGIYIDCYIEGSYTDKPRTRYDHNKGEIVPETHYNIATFKTLRRDLVAMQIMGELCGSLTYFASKYINKNITRYTPTAELEREAEYKKTHCCLCEHFCRSDESNKARFTCTRFECELKTDTGALKCEKCLLEKAAEAEGV